jgi:anaphase-promoting complex subunit 3
MLQAAPQPDPIALSDKTMASNGSLQMHSNPNFNSDPFFSTPKGDAGVSNGSSALWEKLNGSNVSVASVGTTVIHEVPEGQNEEDARVANGTTSSSDMWDPPLAPTRRNRTIQQVEYGDPPPRMKTTALKSRIRPKVESEDQNVIPMDAESVPVTSAGDRKRTISGQVAHPAPQPVEPGAPQRRSTRLLNHIRPTSTRLATSTLSSRDGREVKKVRATGAKGRTATTTSVGRVVSGNRKTMISGSEPDSKEPRAASTYSSNNHHPAKSATTDRSKELEALSWILDLFGKLATAYHNLTRFKCQEAVQAFNLLPQAQRETPWVLSQMGRAYYEQALYPEAEKYFIRVKTLAPSRLEDMEIYSTVLWHLKNDVELSYLAHELMEVDRLSPQAWCAIGNSFSHQRDHDQALKCFKRATQLDPRFAYAFALQGHEHVANEEYDKALDAFRKGISVDSRHYNSWYGLGQVYEKMGKLEYAEQHYRNAVQINPSNAVLICCMGLVIEKMNNPKTALFHYSRATSLAPKSVLARFRKARVLMKLSELKLALAELKVLKDISPDEANVHYLLGKIYKMLHDKANAIKHFTTALNLDPKVSTYITPF